MLKKGLIFVSAVVLLYTLLGFFAVGRIVHSQGLRALQDSLGVQLSAKETAFNPFTLSLTVDDVSARTSNGEALFAFGRLHLNFELISLIRRELALREVLLVRPEIQLIIEKDGSLNLAALASDRSAAERNQKGSSLPKIAIEKIHVEDGRLSFFDRDRKEVFDYHIESLSLDIEHLSTQGEQSSGYRLQARTPTGASLNAEGELGLSPFSLLCRIRFEDMRADKLFQYFQKHLLARAPKGKISLKTVLNLSAKTTPLSLRFSDVVLDFRDFHISAPGGEAPLVSLPSLSVHGAVSVDQKKLKLTRFALAGGKVNLELLPSGELNLASLLAQHESSSGSPGEEEPASQPQSSEKPSNAWLLELAQASVEDLAVSFIDSTRTPAGHFEFSKIRLGAKNLKNRSGKAGDVSFSLATGEKAALKGKGSLELLPLRAALTVEGSDIPLSLFQPYLEDKTGVRLTKGDAELQGLLTIGAQDDQKARTAFQGSFKLHDLLIEDGLRNEMFVGWKSFEVKDLDLKVEPTSIEISTVELNQATLVLARSKDASLNVSELFPGEDKESDQASDAAALPLEIGKIVVTDGTLRYSDRSVTPQYKQEIADLNGELLGLSSKKGKAAKLKLSANLGGYAPFHAEGTLTPFAHKKNTSLKWSLKNGDMERFSPYSVKAVGYKIAKGKLSIDSDVSLEGRELKAENQIVLDQFSLGSKVANVKGSSLPLPFAVSVMRDRRGRIDFDLPIAGNIDKPSFSVRGLILKALSEVVTDVVSAPFSMLGSLYGAMGKKLSYIEFQPQSVELEPAEQEKVSLLAKALRERPGLLLEITGVASRNLDTEGSLNDDSLLELAEQRALRVRDVLLHSNKDLAPQVFMVEPELEDKSENGIVKTRLSLNSR